MECHELSTVGAVVHALVHHPIDRLVRRWNWKAATLSASTRGLLFFVVNLTGGLDAAQAAFVTEFMVRAMTSGFYGTITQAFRRAEPQWAATAAAVVILPLVSHSIEFAAHWARGTEALAASIGASTLFTVISTAFHLHAMREGVLTVGNGSQSLAADLRAIPGLLLSFVGLRSRQRVGCHPVDLPL